MEREATWKGKGKAKASQDGNQTVEEHHKPSMASKIVASASTLAKDMVGTSGANDITNSLVSGSGLSHKSQQESSSAGSSAGSSAWAERLPSRTRDGSSEQAPQTSSPGDRESFRTLAPESTEEFHMTEFLQQPSMHDLQGANPQWLQEFAQVSTEEPQPSPVRSWGKAPKEIPLAAPGVQYDDGTEVRFLLSNPAFSYEADPLELTTEEIADDGNVMDLFGNSLSAEELQAASQVKSAMPAAPVHRPVPTDHYLNLIPDFLSFETSDGHHLLSEWDCVLNHYSDEVWGDALPAVKAARAEIQEVKAGAQPLDSKAVSRLKMILGHVVQNAYPLLEAAAQTPQRQAEHPQDEGRETSRPTFHCPWISCHQV